MDEHARAGEVPSDDDEARFLRAGIVASAAAATRTRKEFGLWLKRHFRLDDERFNDVLLAVYEALANATEYAYPAGTSDGTVDVTAHYGMGSKSLTVNVVDHGHWRPPPAERSTAGGRGISLMYALADTASVDGSAHGTDVTMTWRNLALARLA
jgi:anti-sigma regulatory factor (Ser/Thr protein kinase)